jgi:putative SOS response-associated peptidase YedK
VCNLYSVTSGPQAIRDLVRFTRDMVGNLPPQPAVFPDQLAPVVRTAPDGARELVMMRWGFPQPPPRAAVAGEKQRSGYGTNVRNSLSNWWRPWMQVGHRCLVPVTSFSEYDHRTKPPTCTWFAQDETLPLMFFAGIWRPWTGTRGTKAELAIGNHLLFSFLTTAPNAVVEPVHAKAMPVLLLTEDERETWLTGSLEDALALQRPAPDGAARIVATGQKQDG